MSVLCSSWSPFDMFPAFAISKSTAVPRQVSLWHAFLSGRVGHRTCRLLVLQVVTEAEPVGNRFYKMQGEDLTSMIVELTRHMTVCRADL